MDDCRCEDGFASHEESCVYAYVFHLHGRVWLTNIDKSEFTTQNEEDFKTDMAGVLVHPDLSADEVVQPDDILPYSVHNADNIATDIGTAMYDHSMIVLAESEHEEPTDYTGGIAIGFAVKLRSDSMEYGNALVESMKQETLADDLFTALTQHSEFAGVTGVHVFVWALTAEFWRSETTTAAPYLWAPTHQPSTGPLELPETAAPSELATLAPNQKATVNMALTIACDCHLHDTYPANYLECMSNEGYLSMYRFRSGLNQEQQAFQVAVADALGTQDGNIEITAVAPAGMHPHTADSFSPVHADPYANGIEVHFKAGAASVAEAEAMMDAFDFSQTSTFINTLSENLWNNGQEGAWNVPPQCIMYNTVGEGVNQQALDATLSTHTWYTVTGSPTPAPTPEAQDTPGRDPNCVGGAVIAVHGMGRFASPWPFDGVLDLHEQNAFMTQAREAMASNIDQSELFDGTTIQACDILVTEGTFQCETVENGLEGNDDPLGANYTGLGSDVIATPEEFGPGHDPTTLRQEHAGTVTWCTFGYSINVPNQNMHDGNAVFDQINSDGTSYIKSVNFAIGAGRIVAPPLTEDSNYRPSVPTFSILSVESLELIYVTPQPEYQTTTTTPVPVQDCEFEWSSPTACSAGSCGTGVIRKFALIITPPSGGGAACPDGLVDEEDCDMGPCPVDCEVGPYYWDNTDENDEPICQNAAGEENLCTPMGGVAGFKRRRRDIITNSSNNGNTCPNLVDDTILCNQQPCPQDCELGQWGGFGQCSKQCKEDGGEPGTMIRRREVESPAYFGGTECEDIADAADDYGHVASGLVDEVECNDQPCPTNCVMSEWSEWGSCSKTCAGQPAGTRLFGARQERTRAILTPAANGGTACPDQTQTKLCALHPCGAHVCTTDTGFPLTCTYENDIVYTHHVNDVHDHELFMCYHNFVTEVCTCLCWPEAVGSVHSTHNDERHNAAAGSVEGATVDYHQIPSTNPDTSSVDNFVHILPPSV
jgi:hypothetical protein